MSITPVAKLYYFNPNSYGVEYFVAAYSRGEAIAAVESSIRTEVEAEQFEDDNPAEYDNPDYAKTADEKREQRFNDRMDRLNHYVTATRWPWVIRGPAPCIEEHPIGHVVQTEIS